MSADLDRALVEARALVGTPYHIGMAVPGVGCDCIGVIECVWRAVRKDLKPNRPPVVKDYFRTGQEHILGACREHLKELSAPQPGAVLVFRLAPGVDASHIGICSEMKDGTPFRFIHGHDARIARRVVETTLGKFWLPRLVGIFKV